ncbi:hypothetical protein AR543_02320 [Paenibacillus bovis]|uniref:Uncharacterized protein n=2 Tax=Paenibacillus bovis TaxID=1616788 RepID=A0A172ZCU4_9BACL|nr:hypothetical protein AR543_02320 [Paenibacillus bovis]
MIYYYYVFVLLSAAFSGYGIIQFWPASEQNNDFLLFNDISTAVLFLPSFWVIGFSLFAQLLMYYLTSKKNIYLAILLLYILNFTALFFIAGYNIHTFLGSIVLVTTSAVGLVHLGIAVLLYPLFRSKLHFAPFV